MEGLEAVVEPRDFSALCTDTIIAILSNLDAFQLGRISSVCKTWKEASRDDDLWSELVRARWKLREQKRGRYKYGERSWREVFRVFHRRMKPPQTDGIAPREFVYAAGSSGRIACWLYVTHLPACRLGERVHKPLAPSIRVLVTRCVVQNLRDGPIMLSAPSNCLQLTMRDGTVSQPMASNPPDGKTRVLAPLEVCLLADVAFPVHSNMVFEPDVLEACHRLRLRVGLLPCVEHACAGAGHVAPLEVGCKFVPEGDMWDHYECINHSFLVHHDTRED